MPIENEEIGSDSKNKKIIENFRKQLNIQIARTKVEKTHCKWLIKTINNDDITLFFSSLIKVDSLLWFLNSIHNVYHELFSLYNNKFWGFLVICVSLFYKVLVQINSIFKFYHKMSNCCISILNRLDGLHFIGH